MEIPFYSITKINYSQTFDSIESIFTILAIWTYLFFAIRKFYKSKVVWSLVAAGFIGCTFFTFIQYYRMLLFFKIVFWG